MKLESVNKALQNLILFYTFSLSLINSFIPYSWKHFNRFITCLEAIIVISHPQRQVKRFFIRCGKIYVYPIYIDFCHFYLMCVYTYVYMYIFVHTHVLWPSSVSLVQSLSHVWLFATLWIVAHQASLCITNSRSLLKLMSIESVMPSSHPAISSSVVPFSSCPQSLPASGSFPVSQLFTWGGHLSMLKIENVLLLYITYVILKFIALSFKKEKMWNSFW